MSRPRSAPACSTAIRSSVLMSLPRTISPDTACEALTTVPTSSCSTGAPMVAVARCGDWCLAEMRVQLFELPHLADRAPAEIATPRVPQIGVGDRLEAARRVEPRGHLMGQRPRSARSRARGPIGWPASYRRIGVELSPFEAGDLGRRPMPCLLAKVAGQFSAHFAQSVLCAPPELARCWARSSAEPSSQSAATRQARRRNSSRASSDMRRRGPKQRLRLSAAASAAA